MSADGQKKDPGNRIASLFGAAIAYDATGVDKP